MSNKLLQIIIAEDDDDDAQLFDEALSSFHDNYRLQRVVDGVEFIRLASFVTPNLFVLDLNLPKISGQKCLEWLRSNKTTAGIPVAVLSTSNNETEILEILSNGGVSYFTKPDSFNALIEIAKQIVHLGAADLSFERSESQRFATLRE